jgi:hypothetical protein
VFRASSASESQMRHSMAASALDHNRPRQGGGHTLSPIDEAGATPLCSNQAKGGRSSKGVTSPRRLSAHAHAVAALGFLVQPALLRFFRGGGGGGAGSKGSAVVASPRSHATDSVATTLEPEQRSLRGALSVWQQDSVRGAQRSHRDQVQAKTQSPRLQDAFAGIEVITASKPLAAEELMPRLPPKQGSPVREAGTVGTARTNVGSSGLNSSRASTGSDDSVQPYPLSPPGLSTPTGSTPFTSPRDEGGHAPLLPQLSARSRDRGSTIGGRIGGGGGGGAATRPPLALVSAAATGGQPHPGFPRSGRSQSVCSPRSLSLATAAASASASGAPSQFAFDDSSQSPTVAATSSGGSTGSAGGRGGGGGFRALAPGRSWTTEALPPRSFIGSRGSGGGGAAGSGAATAYASAARSPLSGGAHHDGHPPPSSRGSRSNLHVWGGSAAPALKHLPPHAGGSTLAEQKQRQQRSSGWGVLQSRKSEHHAEEEERSRLQQAEQAQGEGPPASHNAAAAAAATGSEQSLAAGAPESAGLWYGARTTPPLTLAAIGRGASSNSLSGGSTGTAATSTASISQRQLALLLRPPLPLEDSADGIDETVPLGSSIDIAVLRRHLSAPLLATELDVLQADAGLESTLSEGERRAPASSADSGKPPLAPPLVSARSRTGSASFVSVDDAVGVAAALSDAGVLLLSPALKPGRGVAPQQLASQADSDATGSSDIPRLEL